MNKKAAWLAAAATSFALIAAILAGMATGSAAFWPRAVASPAELATIAAALAALSSLSLGLFVRSEAARLAKASSEALAKEEAATAGAGASEKELRKSIAAIAAALPASGPPSALRGALEGLLASASIPKDRLEALASFTASFPASPKEAVASFEDACMVLPLARRIVTAVPVKTEDATMALIERFEAVRELSARAAAASEEAIRHIEGDKGSSSFKATAHNTKAAIEAESAAVASMVTNDKENARKLQTMSKELEAGIELITGIEEITERSRLIAFNMAVEAARIGEKGRGFRVIVNELHSLNDKTQEFSRRIAELLGRYRDYAAGLVIGMAENSEHLSVEVLDVMKVARGAVESLIDSAGSTEDLSARLAGLVVEVDRDLDGVLEALQFQDVTRQMLEGANHLIETAEARLSGAAALLGPAGGGDSKAALARFEVLKRGFIAQAKTKDEKNAIMEA